MPKCANCKKNAVVELEYNKTHLCENCFCDQFENRVRQANKEFKLIKLNQKIGVALSGGKDSSAMLYVLHRIVKNVHGTTLVPILIDEGIEEHRLDAIAKAQELCDKLHLPLHIRTFKDAYGLEIDRVVELKQNMPEEKFQRNCTYCGVFRKNLLNKAALELGCDSLAIGHNADDIAQTFLMNMLHNEPERMKRFDVINDETEGFAPRMKPLIYNPEEECALYCKFKKLPFYRCGCPHATESFRMEIKLFLNDLEKRFPGVKFNLLRSYLAMNGELRKLRGFEEKYGKALGPNSIGRGILKCKRCGQNSSTGICKSCAFREEILGLKAKFGKSGRKLKPLDYGKLMDSDKGRIMCFG
ncbi:MAG: TIGR00269 family protein [Candidatus Micrarchaeota archaeon]